MIRKLPFIFSIASVFVIQALLAQEPLLQIPATKFESVSTRTWVASFELEELPSETVFVFLKAKSRGPHSSASRIEIRLNESFLFLGKWELSPTFWRIKRFPVFSKLLRAGLNRLTVSSHGEKGSQVRAAALEVAEACLANFRFVPRYDIMTDFEVELPARIEPFPTPHQEEKTEPGFNLRGTKGWAWTPEQYLAEIPFLVKTRMNFLMNCYTSMFSDIEKFTNRWWEPLPEPKKRAFEQVVRACQQNSIFFCFSMHPQLFSERPLVPDSPEDFESLWQHYAWMQSLGVKWFNICYDDIGVEGIEKSALGEAHARLVNRLLNRLREKDSQAQVIFCPTYYAGSGEAPEARAYLEALSQALAADVFIFWTGDGVVTPRITRACADIYKKIVGHRLIIWDNYPVNDRNPTLHLGPVTGRDPDLAEVAYGYMSNPLCPQNEINRIPLSTCADYAFNPAAYNPLRSIGQAIRYLAENPSQRQALKNLVELYPGMLLFGDTRTSFNPVKERFEMLCKAPDSQTLVSNFIRRVENAQKQLAAAFPDRYANAKETLNRDLTHMTERSKLRE